MNKNIFINKICLLITLLLLITANSLSAYSILLPDVWPSPSLPYLAGPDHYSGAATVQMILNSTPSVSCRQYHPQTEIYSSILGHNTETTLWFSDPSGILGALEDPALTSCGHWVDYSGTNKDYILGKMAYWMDHTKYLTPVSIGPNEHWVTVFGMQTIGAPNWSGTTDVAFIYFYDPLPGATDHIRIADYSSWTSSPELWGGPLNKPASSWNGKYIAIIEPPRISIKLKIKRWVVEGKILPPDIIRENYYKWQKQLEYDERMPKGIKLLYRNPPIKEPVLVNAAKYSYYLIPFENQNMAAIFNAYTGSFEEFAYSENRYEYNFDRNKVTENLKYQLDRSKLRLEKLEKIDLQYDAYSGNASRLTPVWNAQVIVGKDCCTEYRLNIRLDTESKIIDGLGDLKDPIIDKKILR